MSHASHATDFILLYSQRKSAPILVRTRDMNHIYNHNKLQLSPQNTSKWQTYINETKNREFNIATDAKCWNFLYGDAMFKDAVSPAIHINLKNTTLLITYF